MSEKITVSLDLEDWIDLAKFLSEKIGETVNPMPTIQLLDALIKAGVSVKEMGG